MPERLQLLKEHQSRVEQHLEAITDKIAYYEQQSQAGPLHSGSVDRVH